MGLQAALLGEPCGLKLNDAVRAPQFPLADSEILPLKTPPDKLADPGTEPQHPSIAGSVKVNEDKLFPDAVAIRVPVSPEPVVYVPVTDVPIWVRINETV